MVADRGLVRTTTRITVDDQPKLLAGDLPLQVPGVVGPACGFRFRMSDDVVTRAPAALCERAPTPRILGTVAVEKGQVMIRARRFRHPGARGSIRSGCQPTQHPTTAPDPAQSIANHRFKHDGEIPKSFAT